MPKLSLAGSSPFAKGSKWGEKSGSGSKKLPPRLNDKAFQRRQKAFRSLERPWIHLVDSHRGLRSLAPLSSSGCGLSAPSHHLQDGLKARMASRIALWMPERPTHT